MQNDAMMQLHPTVHTLSNGMRVVLESLPYVHSASAGIWIKTGSANEAKDVAGISHFLEHLFFKGTTNRSARDLMEAIESKGGHINAFTSREYTCLYVKTLDQHLHTGLEVLADIIKNSTYADLEKERNVILEEIAAGIDTPDDYIHDLLAEKFWPDHAIGRPIAGWHDTVSNTGLEQVRTYKEQWYQPENMVIAIVGNVDEAVVLRQLEDEFAALPKKAVPPPLESPKHGAGLALEPREISQNHLSMAFPGTHITNPERYRYDMVNSILGGGMTSRLFESIREEAGLAYSIYSYNSAHERTGMFGMYAAIAPENLQQTVDLIAKELKTLQDTPVSDAEMDSNREQLKGGLLLALENTFNRMARMARSILYFDRILPVDEIIAGVDVVSKEDIQELAQQTFTESQCALAVLGQVENESVTIPL
jgi:predicted Zn-dependent peptidase